MTIRIRLNSVREARVVHISIVPVESGMTIRIRLNSVREARVVHVSREDRGQWSMGCAFSEEITSADVQQLLASPS